MRHSLVFISLFVFSLGNAQNIQTDQKLISSTGDKHVNSNNIEFSYSVGEPVIFSGSSSNSLYTQGFQQPAGRITYSLIVNDANCSGSNDGSLIIENIHGCDGPYEIKVNGEVQIDNSLYGLSAGTYLLEVSGQNCTSEQEVVISENEEACVLHFFNGFTPNNDGTNDIWVIRNIHIPPFDINLVVIYNRWGEVAWKGDNYNNESIVFQGKDMNDKDLPSGTYFYQVEVNEKVYDGYIQLMR